MGIMMTDIDETTIIERVSGLSAPILDERKLEMIDMEFKKEASGWVLRLFIEKKGAPGVSIDDCASVSRELGVVLEVNDTIPVPYHLEVSSPGLTRPLKKEREFRIFAGRQVRILTKFPIENATDITGTLLGLEGDRVRVQIKDAIREIPLAGIAKAHLDF